MSNAIASQHVVQQYEIESMWCYRNSDQTAHASEQKGNDVVLYVLYLLYIIIVIYYYIIIIIIVYFYLLLLLLYFIIGRLIVVSWSVVF